MQNTAPLKFGGYFPPFPLKAGHRHLEEMEKILHRRIDVAFWYQWWGTNWMIRRAAQDFQANWVTESGDRDVLIKWEPWTPGRQIEQPKFAVQTIVNGAHDAYLQRWAQRIRDYGRTIHLCPMPEPNGFWNQWSSVIGKHPPSDYIAAWRHIHGVFQIAGVTNVKWVWNPNAGDSPDENRMEDYYSGSEYVDILGLSVYNWGTARSWSHWRSFREIIQPYYDRIGTLGSQPIWIAEMACAPEGGDRAAWIRAMFEYLPTLPRLETLLWFNTKKETDWRITTEPQIAREFWDS
jgi:beta-mannanase